MTEKSPASQQTPDDFDLALIAMERAANTALERARLRDGKLVAWRQGRLVQESVPDKSEPRVQTEEKRT